MSKNKSKTGKQFKDFERPRLAPCFKQDRPRWLVMEPAPLAALFAVCCAFLVLLIQVGRQLSGAVVSPGMVIVSIGFSFVVAYTAAGLFIYYVLRVVDRELWSKQRAEAEAMEAEKRAAREAEMEAAMEAASAIAPGTETTSSTPEGET